MQANNKKTIVKRYRIDRNDGVQFHEDENAHLWAVSYADFLMALLSFFILFFSIDGEQKENLILRISRDFASVSEGTGHKPASTEGEKLNQKAIRDISSVFENELNVEEYDQYLTLNFKDNMFDLGKFKLVNANKETIKQVLLKLKPYEEGIKIYFEGHADSIPLNKKIGNITLDNYMLSSLRATEVLGLAREIGFSERSLFIQSASSHERNTRSVSIRIEKTNMSKTALDKERGEL